MNAKKKRPRVQGGWASNKSVAASDWKKEKNLSEFSFQPTTEVKKEKSVITYSDPGSYVLSETSNGCSSVILCREFIKKEECKWMFSQLLNEIPWKEKKIIVNGEQKTQPRLCAWFGDKPYSYSGLRLEPFQFSPLLTVLKEQVTEKCSMQFNSLLANLYRNEKDSVDWHSDDEKELGKNPQIASLSFGATRMFEMKRKGSENDSHQQIIKFHLDNGSLLVMKGATQSDWQHCVPKEYHDREARINLTFRWINEI